MTVLTLDLPNISEEDIQDFEKTHRISIHDVMADYLKELFKKSDMTHTKMDVSDIESLMGKYAKYAKNPLPKTDDEINHIVGCALKEKWATHESN